MGIYDRDYYRGPGSRNPFASLNGWSVTTWLIVINVAVFLLDGMLRPRLGHYVFRSPLERWGHFSLETAIYYGQAWRFITFQFLHASLGHLLGNMFALYFFGPMVEAHYGSRRFLYFYLLCGVAGAISYIVLWAGGGWAPGPMTRFLVMNANQSMVGASAGIFGILVAAAWMAPDQQVMLLFPPIPLKLKTLAWIMMGIAAYTVFTHGHNAGGEAAHLGGGILGLILIVAEYRLDLFTRRRSSARLRLHKDWSQDFNR